MSFDEVVGDEVELVGFDAEVINALAGDDPDVAALLAAGDEGHLLSTGDDALAELGLAGDDDAIIAGAASSAFMRGLPAAVKARVLASVKRARTAKQRAALGRLAAQRAIGIRKRPVLNAGEVPMGFEQLIAAGASAVIPIRPPVPFNPKRLMIDSSIAPSFRLDDLSCGMRRLMVTSNPVPATVFAEVSVNQGWRIPTIQIGQELSMRFTNKSGADATLSGAWLGTYAD